MRSLDYLGRRSEAKDCKKTKKQKQKQTKKSSVTDGLTDGWTDGQSDGPTKRGVELHSTRLFFVDSHGIWGKC